MKVKTILIALAASSAAAKVIVGTNSFDVVFEANNLAPATQSRIVDDINLCRQLWTNSVVHLNDQNKVQYIYDGYVIGRPYFNEMRVPRNLVTNATGALSVFVSKPISDAYIEAFEFVDANSNIIAAAATLINALADTNIVLSTVAEVSEYVFVSSDKTIELPTDFRGFTQSTHSMPSVMAFGYETIDSQIPTGSASNLTMKLQYRYKSSVDQHWCIWHDGKWKLGIWEHIQ